MSKQKVSANSTYGIFPATTIFHQWLNFAKLSNFFFNQTAILNLKAQVLLYLDIYVKLIITMCTLSTGI